MSTATSTVVSGDLSTSTSTFVFDYSTTAGLVSYGSLSYYFRLDDLPNYTEFTALYDKYSVRGFQVRVNAYNNSSAAGAAYSGSYPQAGLIMHYVTDHDDSSIPTASEVGVNDLRQYSSYRTRNLIRSPVKHYVKSKSLVGMVNSSSSVVGSASIGKSL